MDRRSFLKSLPVLGALLLEYNQAIGRELPRLLLSTTANHLLVFPAGGRGQTTLPIQWQNEVAFVSAQRLAAAFGFNTYFNEQRRKLVIYLPMNKMVVAADNPFVIIDNQPYQMPVYARWRGGEIYIPVAFLIPLLVKYTAFQVSYNAASQELREGSAEVARPPITRSSTGFEIDYKENGVVVRIGTDRSFLPGEMSLTNRYDWLHIDLYKARVNAALVKSAPLKKPVREVKVTEFDELCSIGLRLSRKPISKRIYQDASTGDVVVTLQYKEALSEEETQEVRNEQVADNNPDIHDQLEAERSRWLIDTVVIDPGHGGKDPGAIGYDKLREKDVVLSIGLMLGEMIQKKLPGINLIYTRRDDTFVELRRRTQIANENNGKVFISIHANANKNSGARGFETYLLGAEKGDQARNVAERENAVIKFEDSQNQTHYKGINTILATMATSAFMRQSEHLASSVQNGMADRIRTLDMKNRGVKQAPFWVMVGASMPCVLVET
ncbi:MAG TPA: N-acetylmuramoyl-L-alanine amidase, partial [Calditrichia bacterium]|nr:N-acetylmuramoyl-L-alanine amidase [Calditrichia bacterium]